MNTYYGFLLFLTATLFLFVIHERKKYYVNFSFGINKVLPISIGLSLMFVGQTSYYSTLPSILSILALSCFMSYRVQLKESISSSAELISDTFGKSTRIFFGIISFTFCIILLYEQALGFFKVLKNCSPHLSALLIMLPLAYLAIILALGSFEIVAWHQIMFLISFVLFCLISREKGQSTWAFANIIAAKFKALDGIVFKRGFWSTLFFITPLQAQILWLFQDKKYARRTYKLALGVVVYSAILYLAHTYFVNDLSSVSAKATNQLEGMIGGIPGFPVAAICYQFFFIAPLVYFSSYFLMNDIVLPIAKKELSGKEKTILKATSTVIIVISCFSLSYLLQHSIPFVSFIVDLLLLSFQLPLFLVIMNVQTNIKELYLPVIIAYVTYAITSFLSVNLNWVPILTSLIVSLISFLSIHYYANKNIVFKTLKGKEKRILAAHYITCKKIKNFFISPIRAMFSFRDNIDYYGAPYNTASAFLGFFFLCMPILFKQSVVYEHALSSLTVVVGIGVCLACFLFLYPCWPTFLSYLFPFYWHFTLIYSLSFFPIFSYFMLGHPSYWLVIIALSTLLLGRFMPGKSFVPLHFLGSATAILLCNYVFKVINMQDVLANNKVILITFGLTYIASSILSYILLNNRHYPLQYTERALRYLSEEFLHFNTNLVAMAKTPAALLNMILSSKLKEISKDEDGNIIFKTDQESYNLIQEQVRDILHYIDLGSEIVRRRSRYFSPIKETDFSYYSASDTIEDAMKTFERINTAHHSAPKVIVKKDFNYYGSDNHLEQAILNLIECTFAHCGKDVKKEIIIQEGKIIYQYYGKSIATKEKPYLFTYLAYGHGGTGYYKEVGALAYVKKVMNAFGGDVVCYCHVDPDINKCYTRFTLYLPNVMRSVE